MGVDAFDHLPPRAAAYWQAHAERNMNQALRLRARVRQLHRELIEQDRVIARLDDQLDQLQRRIHDLEDDLALAPVGTVLKAVEEDR